MYIPGQIHRYTVRNHAIFTFLVLTLPCRVCRDRLWHTPGENESQIVLAWGSGAGR